MPLLNQVLAVESGTKKTYEAEKTRIHQRAQKPELFVGRIRTYNPKAEEGEQLPDETQFVVASATDLLEEFAQAQTRLFDITATKVWANTEAHADVVVDDEPVLRNVPVEYLLFLEKQLGDAATFVAKIPTLDPTDRWNRNEEQGWYETAPVDSIRYKKVLRNHVKAEPTDKHAAQVEVYTEDVAEGTWHTTKLSGAMPASERRALLERIGTLSAAVKMAREEANSIQVLDQEVGETVFDWLLRAG